MHVMLVNSWILNADGLCFRNQRARPRPESFSVYNMSALETFKTEAGKVIKDEIYHITWRKQQRCTHLLLAQTLSASINIWKSYQPNLYTKVIFYISDNIAINN